MAIDSYRNGVFRCQWHLFALSLLIGISPTSARELAPRGAPTEAPLDVAVDGHSITAIATAPQVAPKNVAIIVPGSGNLDQDGNDGLFIKTSLYRQIAIQLGSRGTATIRYKKRSFDHKLGIVNQKPYNSFQKLVEDTRKISSFAKEEWGVDCI